MKPLLLLTILIIGHCIRESPPQFRGVATVTLSSHSHFQQSYLLQLKQSIKLSSLLHEVYDVDMTIIGKFSSLMYIFGINMYCTNIFMIDHFTFRPSHIDHAVYL